MTRYRSHPLDEGNPPAWASSWGEDPYGVFVGFTVDGVEQRMRWIHPGSFQMGSPEDEPGRDDDEIRHEVTLTQGFWLADTPCTQALWQVVTGENSSRFQTPERPVEQVSWHDAKRFLGSLGERVPGLEPRLPTEAEWEYACRAGTKDATYAGPIEIKGANNAPVLHDIAWYGGNSGVAFDLDEGVDSSGWLEKQFPHTRAGARPVAQKIANPWGLYDTLGNVWEWCDDWFGAYDLDRSTDPPGPNRGTSRVVRGGSWISNARHMRAAFRSRYAPSDRNFNLGFRLARGP